MKRRLFSFAALLSWLICMATVVMWVRSYRNTCEFNWITGGEHPSSPGVIPGITI